MGWYVARFERYSACMMLSSAVLNSISGELPILISGLDVSIVLMNFGNFYSREIPCFPALFVTF